MLVSEHEQGRVHARLIIQAVVPRLDQSGPLGPQGRASSFCVQDPV